MKNRLAVALITFWTLSAAAQQNPDLILTGGRIFTADPAKPWAESVAIAGNKITAVGSTEEVTKLAGPDTKRIPLAGHVVIPGINDAHAVVLPQPENFRLSLTPESDAAAISVALISASDESPSDMWITGTITAQALNDPVLTASFIDKAAPGRKVMLSAANGHGFVFSSAALTALRIRRDTADPKGGSFGRDANGDPNGKAMDYAGWNSEQAYYAQVTDNDMAVSLRELASRAHGFGITSIQNVVMFSPLRYEKALRHADVPLRIRMIRFPATDSSGRNAAEGSTIPIRDRERPLTVASGIAWNLDGIGPDDKPTLNFPYAELVAMLAESLASNNQIILDIGNITTTAAVLDAMKTSAPAGWSSRRLRIDGDAISSDLLPALKASGIVVVPAPAPSRVALKSLIRAGVPVALGSHGGDINPFEIIRRVITTGDRSMTREDAVEAYTSGSAFAEFTEGEKGTITAGKLADLAVLSQDIFKVKPDELPDTVSVLTIVDGKIVYDSGVIDVPGRKQQQRPPID